MEIRDLRGLTLIVSVMAGINALLTSVTMFAPQIFPEFYSLDDSVISTRPGLLFDFAVLGFTLLTYILFSRWIYLAGRNLVEAGCQNLEFTPAARIWWFAAPIANLYKPFQGMRELWNASHGNEDYSSETASLVAIWWALWLLSGFSSLGLMFFLEGSGEPDLTPYWVSAAIEIVLAIVAIAMIRRIAEAQTQLSDPRLAEVFA